MPPKRDPLPVFSGLLSFYRAPTIDRSELPEGSVAVAGVAFDHTCTGRIGSRFGPRAIRETSVYFGYHFQAGGAEMIEVVTGQVLRFPSVPRLFDVGDLNIYPAHLDWTHDSVAEGVSEIFDRGSFPVILGGDEFIASMIAAGTRTHAVGLAIVWVSGHLALGDHHALWGDRWGGATARRIIERSIVAPDRLGWLGINGWCRSEEWSFVERHRMPVYRAGELASEAMRASAVGDVIARLGGPQTPILLCVDISALDGVFAAGSSLPSFTGLSNNDLLALLDLLAGENLAGIVVTGVNPTVDPTWTAQRLASMVVLRLIAPRFLAGDQQGSSALAEDVRA